MAKVNPVIALADELVEELYACGHDEISTLDILDALASTGLTLVNAVDSEARDAYVEALGVKVVS